MTYLALKTDLFTNHETALNSLKHGPYEVKVLDLSNTDQADDFWDGALEEILAANRVISL